MPFGLMKFTAGILLKFRVHEKHCISLKLEMILLYMSLEWVANDENKLKNWHQFKGFAASRTNRPILHSSKDLRMMHRVFGVIKLIAFSHYLVLMVLKVTFSFGFLSVDLFISC